MVGSPKDSIGFQIEVQPKILIHGRSFFNGRLCKLGDPRVWFCRKGWVNHDESSFKGQVSLVWDYYVFGSLTKINILVVKSWANMFKYVWFVSSKITGKPRCIEVSDKFHQDWYQRTYIRHAMTAASPLFCCIVIVQIGMPRCKKSQGPRFIPPGSHEVMNLVSLARTDVVTWCKILMAEPSEMGSDGFCQARLAASRDLSGTTMHRSRSE